MVGVVINRLTSFRSEQRRNDLIEPLSMNLDHYVIIFGKAVKLLYKSDHKVYRTCVNANEILT